MRPDLPLMLFAAGFGTRMGALTADRPKPLIPVAGRALIDHALDLANAAGVARKVVNTHYRADQIATHLAGRDIAISHEDVILETGGGLRRAVPLLGPGPVLTLNTDAVWTGENPLTQLRAAWDAARMDVLVLLAPADRALGHPGRDFLLGTDGRIARALGQRSFAYLGAQIVDPSALSGVAAEVFSLSVLWDRAIAAGRAYGLVHQGGWCDVGTPEGIALAEALLQGAADD